MPTPKGQMVRVLVKQIKERSSACSSYCIIAFGDTRAYGPVHFDSLDELLNVLRTVLPELDASSFRRWSKSGMSILLADVLELSDEQLSDLGFNDQAESASY